MANSKDLSRTEQVLGDILPNRRRTRECDKPAAERLSVLRELLESDLDYNTTISYVKRALHNQELNIKFVNVLTSLFTHVVRWRDNPETLNSIPRVDAQLLIWLIFSYSDAKKVWSKFVDLTVKQLNDAEEITKPSSSTDHVQTMRLEQRLRFVRTMLEDNIALDTKARSGEPTISNFRGCGMSSGNICPECLLDWVDEVYLKLKDRNDKDEDFRRWYDDFAPEPQEDREDQAPLLVSVQLQDVGGDELGKSGQSKYQP